MPEMTSEDVVQLFRSQPERRETVHQAYWDEDVLAAGERFWSGEEFAAVLRLLAQWLPGRSLRILDLGAGVGFASYAFAREGHQVIAVEPDPSPVVGRGAFEELAARSGLPMRCVPGVGENLPPEAAGVDLVYTRQVLHHASDLHRMMGEAFRMLRPGGFVLATREHVVSREDDLPRFLDRHETHRYLQNEHAYLLQEYLDAFRAAGFRVRRVLGPADSSINRYPQSDLEFRRACARSLARLLPGAAAERLCESAPLLRLYARWVSWREDTPGRLYSFLLQRPKNARNP
jgi:SAM-dependent methyltransferase